MRSLHTKNAIRLSFLFAIWTLAAQSCNWPTDTACEDGIGCATTGSGGSAMGGVGGSSQSAGEAGKPEPSNGGSAQGGTGDAGSAGLAGAGAGAAGAPPCDGTCSGETPVCKLETDVCVQCLTHSDCAEHGDGGAGGAAGAGGSSGAGSTNGGAGGNETEEPRHFAAKCKTESNTCVECLSNADCRGSTPVCDLTRNACVECLAEADCADPSRAVCNLERQACEPCTSNEQCGHIAGKNVCGSSGECVQCTALSREACGSKDGTPLVCNALTSTCSADVKEHSSGFCAPCVSDAQCQADQLCVLDQFQGSNGTIDVGHFCHQKASAVQNDCTTARPYLRTMTAALSIDGQVSDVCTLRASTCVASAQFSQKDCSESGVANDSLCGVAPGKDAICQAFGSTGYLCTMTCLSDLDCRAPSTCNTGVTPAVCSFF